MGAPNRRRVRGPVIGVYAASVGASWVELTPDDFKDSTANNSALSADHVFSDVEVYNSHASQTMYLKFGTTSMTGGTTDGAIVIPAGATYDIELTDVAAVQISGSGASTTGSVTARFFSS